MRAFFVLLIMSNLAAWGLFFWNQRHERTVVQSDVEFRFEPAKRELQLLDLERANLRETVPTESVATGGARAEPAVRQATPASAPELDQSEASIQAWCGMSGELDSDTQALSWLESWRNLGGEGRLIESKEPVSSTWWVHLPPFETEAQARAVLKELQEKSIDSFYMRTGELVGGISLGVFAIRDSAFRVQANMRDQGYKAEVKEVQKMVSRIKLFARLENRLSLEQPNVQSLLLNSTSISLEEIPCE